MARLTRSKTQAGSTRLEWQAQIERTREALGLGADTTRATLEMYSAQIAQLNAVLAVLSRLS